MNHSQGYWRIIGAICLASMLIFANLYVVQALLPTLQDQLGIGFVKANHLMSVATLTMGLSLPLLGLLSDWVGRKLILLTCLFGLFVTVLLIPFNLDYEVLFFIRGLQGIFIAGIPAVSLAYFSDELPKLWLPKAVGLYISANSIGGLGGRLLGGVLADHLNLQQIFIFMAGLSLLMGMAILMLLPRASQFSPSPSGFKVFLSQAASFLKDKQLSRIYLLGGLNMMIFLNLYGIMIHRLNDSPFQLSQTAIAMLFLTYLFGSYSATLARKFTHKPKIPLGIALGVGLMMLGGLVSITDSYVQIWCAFGILSFGFFLTHSLNSSWIAQHVSHNKGLASSLYLLSYYLGASVGGYYLAPFWNWANWLGVVMAASFIFLFTLFLSLNLVEWKAISLKVKKV